MKKMVLLVVGSMMASISYGQLFISSGTPVTENFDGIGATAIAALPANWKVSKNATARTVDLFSAALAATERVGGENLTSSASNGIYNFGIAPTASSTDRSIGFLSSTSGTKSGNLFTSLTNDGENQINSFDISYNAEKFRDGTNAAGFSIRLFYSTDGIAWTDAGNSLAAIFTGADAATAGYANPPGTTIPVSGNINVSLGIGATVYLAWNYSVTSGTTTSNSQALAIDDISITGNAGVADLPPAISNVNRASVIPAASADLGITADITDDNTISSAYVIYTLNGGAKDSTVSTGVTAPTYSFSIPGTSLLDGTLLTYYIGTTDNAGHYVSSTSSKVFVGLTPISTIRNNDGNGLNIYANAMAKVTGVASSSNPSLGGANMDWFLQDETGGINIFKFGDNTYSVTIGNSYTVVGTVTPFRGRLELVPTATTDITDNGVSTETFELVTFSEFVTNPELYEGELIAIKNVIMIAGTWPTTATNSYIKIQDNAGTDTTGFSINNTTSGIEPVGAFDVIGVVRQEDASSPFTSGYFLVPRSSNDFAPANSLPVELSSFTVSASGKNALIKWETTTETNNAGFELLRNGQSIAFISGKGTTTEKQTYSFMDKNVSGTVSYQLKQVDTDGKVNLSQVLSFTGTPASFEVSGNYPNPFNPSTTIKFTLPEVSNVVVKVHNIIGQEIATLVNGKLDAGVKEIRFDASSLASGIYFYSVSANGKTFTKSMTLMK